MRTVFVPWPQPVAAGLLLGVLVAAALPASLVLRPGFAAGALALALVLSGALAALSTLGLWRWPTSLDTARPRTLLAFALPLALAAAVGAGRYSQQQLRGGPLPAELASPARSWVGVSDGAILSATEPARAKLALVAPPGGWPAGGPPVGRVTLAGTVESPDTSRNPGGYDFAAHFARRDVRGQLRVSAVVGAPRPTVLSRLQRGVTAGLTPGTAAVMSAMTLGLRHDLGDVRDAFGAAGMAHLLALSGLHVGVLLLALERLLARAPRWRTPALAALAVSFVAIVGASPSVVRAATMALAALASRAFGSGRIQPWTALALAATIGVSTDPVMVFDLSFQLSYLAVAGMLLFLPRRARSDQIGQQAAGVQAAPELGPLTDLGRGPGRALASRALAAAHAGASVSLAAQLPSLSIVASSFGTVPLLSPLVNVLAVPLATVLVPLGFLAGLLGLAAEPLARALNLLTGPLASLLLLTASAGARLPSVPWGNVSWLGHAAWFAFTAALARSRLSRRHVRPLAVTALAALGVTALVPPALVPPDVWFLDVGQGDAVLLRLPGGSGVLIDGGGSPFSDYDVGGRVVLPALRALGVTTLAAVVATHPDADHVEGLIPVLKGVPVGVLITGPPDDTSVLDRQLRQTAAGAGVPVHTAVRGQRLVLPGGSITLAVLHPPADATGPANERSVALLLERDGAPVALFLGDAGAATEERLAVPHVELLMVAHHGSRGSTSEALLRAATPRVAVISVGRNNYGHPNPEVIERLEAAGVQLFTTLQNGAVRVGLSGDVRPLPWVTP